MKTKITFFIIFSIFLSLIIFLVLNRMSSDEVEINSISKLIEVKFSGAIEDKTSEFVEYGTKLSEIIYKHHLKPNANISKIDFNQTIVHDITIKIPAFRNEND
ncbi:MAG: hypothetical protein NC236_01980 [Mycoplasma sp.]|nr:hypothetical protein [Mycoplasma sp.]